MKKYWMVFYLSWARQFEYRFNFFLGRMRNIIVLLLLFYVWKSLTLRNGSFAGYSEIEIITYVFVVNIIRSIIFGSQSSDIAQEINQGIFSKYLAMPVNYFWYNFFRQLAQRVINLISAIIEVVIFAIILKVDIFAQTNWVILLWFGVSVFLAICLYFVSSYSMNLLAFFSREAMGPKFLFDWILEFGSGAYFPLSILSRIFFIPLMFLPFAYLVYFPVEIYLGRVSFWQANIGICFQIFWILVAGLIARIVWKKGLRRYSGEGI
ncbi:MAG: ABC-2 type transport system permease protein [Parcubacteria group bacterium Athens0714_25]|nr:MAG: ABC-2 type transport system permease protein [Parcubacteria group bacterium Athens0714_25]